MASIFLSGIVFSFIVMYSDSYRFRRTLFRSGQLGASSNDDSTIISEKMSSSMKAYKSFLRSKSQKTNDSEDKINNMNRNSKLQILNEKLEMKTVQNSFKATSTSYERNNAFDKKRRSIKRSIKRNPLDELSFSNIIKVTSNTTNTLIDNMNIAAQSKHMLVNVKGFTELTPIQTWSYDYIFSGTDVVCRSKTSYSFHC
jgi:glutamate mutase epsilon subunit